MTGPGRVRRLPAILLVAAVGATGLVVGHVTGRRSVQATVPPAAVASEVAPAGAQSASWYCTGGTGPADPVAQATLLLANTTGHRVRGSVRVVDGRGRHASVPVVVAAHAQASVDPGRAVPGAWLSATVALGGGGVVVTEVVRGPAGWAAAPCASQPSTQWYFADGSTAAGDALEVSLYNPVAALAVVDLSFVTPSGLVQPQSDQGIVLDPGRTATVAVGAAVQDQAAVATEVTARSGSVVAAALEVHGAGGLSGLSLRLGAPVLDRRWVVPRAQDPPGGDAELVVLNPAAVSQRVTVRVRLSWGPVTPFSATVGPGAAWVLQTGAQTRIPAGTAYTAAVAASGGPGVVVERAQGAAATAPAPQWGAAGALSSALVGAARRWVVPSLAAAGVAGSLTVSLANPSSTRSVTAEIRPITPAGLGAATTVRLAPEGFDALAGGNRPVLVVASGPVAVAGDQSPPAGAGQVAFPAVPLG